MKRIIGFVLAIAAMAAFAEYQFVEVRGASRGVYGNAMAFDVQSTNAMQAATLNRVRSIFAYTNALDIGSSVVTNAVYFPETVVTNGITNIVQGVSNVVSVVVTTNGWRKAIAGSCCATSEIARVTCANGFATTNISAWVLKDDALVVECSDKAAKTTVIIKK